MIKLDWQKMGDDVKAGVRSIKPLNMLLAFGYVDQEKLEEVVKDLAQDGSTVLIGVVTDQWFPGLEGSEQFKPATYAEVEEAVKKLETAEIIAKNKVAIIQYESQNIKYIVRELQPVKMVRFNGTWANVMHYQKEFWEAYNLNRRIEQVSPFISEESAIKRSDEVDAKNKTAFEKLVKEVASISKPSDNDFIKLASKASYLSWDWTGRTGAVLVQDGEIISWSENIVVPYQSYIFHEGALREKTHSPVGENIEMHETNHAESATLVKALKLGKKIDVSKCVLYTSKFPCPVCARIIADSGIKHIVYTEEYTNEIGYRVLKGAKVECVKI